jgi:hypothetical protein
LPTATNLGDVNSVHYYQEVMNNIVKLDDPPIENPALPELMRIVSKVFEISEIIAALSSKLSEKIFELEKNILAKTPRGYNWGVDPQIQNRIAGVSRTFGKTSSPVGIHERLSLLKSGPAAVETAAYAVKDYSIAHELLINYTIIESIIEKTLQEEGVVSYDNLPVKRQYSHKYLELYCLKHPGEVLIEADTGRLTKPHESQPEIRPGSKNTNKTMSRK